MPFERYIAGDIVRAEIGFYDENGYPCGSAGTLAPGESAGMAWLTALQDMGINRTAPQIETQTGDGRRYGSMTFAPTANTQLALKFGVNDLQIQASVENTIVVDDGDMKRLAFDPIIARYPNAYLIVHTTAKEEDYGSLSSAEGFEIYVVNKGQISHVGADAVTERTLRNYTHQMACEQTYRYPWGEPYTTVIDGTIGGGGGQFISDNYMTQTTFYSDGTEDTITLNQVPATDHATATTWNIYYYDISAGTYTAVTSGFTVTPATRQFVFDAVPGAGRIYTIRYKFDNVLIA